MGQETIKRKRVLYLGLDASRAAQGVEHLPMIKIVPRHFNVPNYDQISHIVFTSRTAVSLFADRYSLKGKVIIAIGPGTNEALQEVGFCATSIAQEHTAEGVIEVLEQLELGKVLLPHASCARPLLPSYLKARGYLAIPVYDTELIVYHPLPSLEGVAEIIFTSPSTVRAFFKNYRHFPPGVTLTAIGPITQAAIDFALKKES